MRRLGLRAAWPESPARSGEGKAQLKAGLDKFYAAAEKIERVYLYAMLYSAGG